MFKIFSKYKVNYKALGTVPERGLSLKGQVFPFLIALICVMIILAMITVNLGQLALYKTDVSNAADAAALAGASILSATLLGLGLKSDLMAGTVLPGVMACIVACITGGPLGIITAIIAGVVMMTMQIVELAYARAESRLGWTNAKKTALQYAFNNAGVDEPRMTYKEFLPYCSEADCYSEYLKGESQSFIDHAQPGFSKFLANAEAGYWRDEFGKTDDPEDYSAVHIYSGYGWTTSGTAGSTTASYPGDVKNYKNYENWVEVEVMGSSVYALEFYTVGDIFYCISEWITNNIDELPWYWQAVMWIVEQLILLVALILCWIPMGIDFVDGNITNQVDNNPIYVTVRRKRRNANLGLWEFQYPELKASASAHAFQEPSVAPIIYPAFLPASAECSGSWDEYKDADFTDYDKWFRTKRHLFETELISAY